MKLLREIIEGVGIVGLFIGPIAAFLMILIILFA
jgi:hypothetical protein